MIKRKTSRIVFILTSAILVTALLAGCSAATPSTSSPAPVRSQPPSSTVVPESPPASNPASTPASTPPSTQPSTHPSATAVTSTSAALAASVVPPGPTVSPTPSLTPAGLPFPTTIYKPSATPYIPAGAELELFNYVLQLINKDRADHKLPPVELAFNAAAQKHAQDMLDNNFLAHWGTDGLKPYMRYTNAGGLNFEGENSAYSHGSAAIDVKSEIAALQFTMVYDDAASNWGHRDTILNKLHKKVSIGLAFSSTALALVQQFEGDYLEYYQPPTLQGKVLTLSGRFKLAGLPLNNVTISYDPLPQALTRTELVNGPYHSYGLGPRVGLVFPPPPPNATYTNLPAGSIIAAKGLVKDDVFWLEADISTILAKGPGVYTVCLVAVLDNRPTAFTNYSIVVR